MSIIIVGVGKADFELME